MNIVIAGASQGIGKALVQHLNTHTEHHIVAISRKQEALNELIQACANQANITTISFDFTTGNYELLQQQIELVFSSIDILVYNAGLLINKPFQELNDTDIAQLFQTNTFGAWKLVKYLHPNIAKGGHIVTISSMGGFQGSVKFAGLSAYSASKAALACWSECLAEELKPQQIAVNCLCLGAVQTDMLRQAFPDFKAPLSANEMACFIADFALSGHRFFNGKVLPVSVNTP